MVAEWSSRASGRRQGQRQDLEALKERLLIPELWRRLGLPGQPGKSCRSPFRPDRSPSFALYDGGRRWHDHGTGEGGDAIDFLAQACHLDKAEATRRFLSLLGISMMTEEAPAGRGHTSGDGQRRRAGDPTSAHPHSHAHRHRHSHTHRHSVSVSPSLDSQHPPCAGILREPLPATEARRVAVARSRGLSVQAISLAESLHTLRYGRVCGHDCWILTDASHQVAEARRLDGQPFPPVAGLGARKAHTLRGSHKDWPCGTAVLRRNPAFRSLMIVEGGPDYLAALHLLLEMDRWDLLPVALLGRSTGTRLSADALHLMAGRRVRLYPHADADGGGQAAAKSWARQLHKHGCTCDLFDFSGLRQADGRAVKDLNDAVFTDAALHPQLAALLPPPAPPQAAA